MRNSKEKNTTKVKLTGKQKAWRHLRRFLRVFAGVSVFFILVHTALPLVLTFVLNKELRKMPEYVGHLESMDVNLFTLNVAFNGFTMYKRGGEIPVPFVDIERLWVGIDWKALKEKRVVGKIQVDDFTMNFVKGPTKATSQTKMDKNWIDLFDKIIPVDINTLRVNDGEVHYMDYHSVPKIDVFVDNIHVLAENLSTVEDTTKILPASLHLTANVYRGSLRVDAKVNIFKKGIPDFDVNAEIKNLYIPSLNNFLKAYAKMDVEDGLFSVYAEAAAKEGRIKGYAKPFIKDLDVITPEEVKEEKMTFKQQIIESLVEVVNWIFKNKKTDNLATKIDLEGRITNPDVSVWGVIGDVLINAFIEAFIPTLENSVNIYNIGKEDEQNFLEKIFDPKNKKGKKNKEKKKEQKNKKETKKQKDPPKKNTKKKTTSSL